MPLTVLHLSQDDPKKCSALKMSRFGLARIVKRVGELPGSSIVLDPFSGVALSPADRPLAVKGGICAIDCSWERAEEVFATISAKRRNASRTLPMLLACNPVHFGRWGELSTIEAMAAALYILGEPARASELLSIYNWGIRFLEVNAEPLDAYSQCRDGAEVVRTQSEFV